MKALIKRKNNSDLAVIIIQGNLTIDVIGRLHESMMQHLSGVNTTKIDLSGITRIDTAGLQFLISMKKYLINKGREIHLEKINSEVKRIINLYNIQFFEEASDPNEL